MRQLLFAATAFAIAAGTFTAGPVAADPPWERGNGDHQDNGKHKGWYKHGGDDQQVEDRGDDRRGDDRRGDYHDRYTAYDYNRPDPRYGNYAPERYYRQGNYPARQLTANDRVYRGGDGRYYCRRSDGTTGLIIGGLGGGVLGNVIAPNGSKTLGTILGAVGGGLIGRSVDRGKVTCS
jgi:hypothetical protein